MPTPSTRLGLEVPDGATDPADGPLTFGQFAAILDDAALVDRGVLASRPTSSPGTPGIVGRLYIVSDEDNRLDLDYGTGWVTLVLDDDSRLTDAAKVFRSGYTFTRDEDTAWPASGKRVGSFRIRLDSGQTAVISTVEHMLQSGSGTTFKLQKNGSDVTGYTAIAPTTTEGQTDAADVAVADGDRLDLICTAVGTGKGGYVEVTVKHTV